MIKSYRTAHVQLRDHVINTNVESTLRAQFLQSRHTGSCRVKNKMQGQVVPFKPILDFITQSSNLLYTVSFFDCPFSTPFSVSSPATSFEDQKSGLQTNPPFISLSVKSCVDRGMGSLFVYICVGAQIFFHSTLIPSLRFLCKCNPSSH